MTSLFEVDPELEREYFKEYESDENEKKPKKEKKQKPKKLPNENQKSKNIEEINQSLEILELKEKPNKNKIEKKQQLLRNNESVDTEQSRVEETQENVEVKGVSEDKERGDKKKKKSKKDEKAIKKEPADKKKLNKAQLNFLKEALKKKEEEELAFQRQEDERIQREEQAEVDRLEKIRLEEERKLKKKLKEKEKKERLKQEGKLLTKAQKQAKARAEAMLQAMRDQGIALPVTENRTAETKSKKIIYDTKRKPKKNVDPINAASTATNQPSTDAQKIIRAGSDDLDESDTSTSEGRPDSDLSADEDNFDGDIKAEWDEGSSTISSLSDAETDAKNGARDGDAASLSSPFSELNDAEMLNGVSAKISVDADKKTEKTATTRHHYADEDTKINLQEVQAERIRQRIIERKIKAESNLSLEHLRAPVICIMGHVDTGKTKILDKLRKTHVQENEAGGITQQIGATNVPKSALIEQIKYVNGFKEEELKIPGMLIIDTPGHESFKNLRNRGSSLCNIGILVVDIMHGMEPQTLESLKTMLAKKIPFVIALNKIDRLHQWKTYPNSDVADTIKRQSQNVLLEFTDRVKNITVQFAEQCVNVALFYSNPDPSEFVSMIPTSAHSGDGMGNLMFSIIELAHNQCLSALRFSPDLLECSVMEVKELPGMGTTLDCILVNGTLREGDNLIVAGFDGAICTQIRGLLLPQPLKDLRVKNQYDKHKEVSAALGVKVIGKDLENALPGFPVFVAQKDDEIDILKEDLNEMIQDTLQSIKLSDVGVYVQASTIGSLEALLDFLRSSKIPYSGINIGPIHKKDVMKAAAMLEHNLQYAVMLAFDVRIDKDAQEMADTLKIKIFSADIIYHLFDKFTQYQEEFKASQKEKHKDEVVFPCKLTILPQYIFKTRDPIIVGVMINAGELRIGTPLCVPSKENLLIGLVSSIEFNHKNMEAAKKGQEVCIKIETAPGETPKLYGRHFDHQDAIISKISRNSIDVLKEYFRDEMQKSDWQLVVELKKILQII